MNSGKLLRTIGVLLLGTIAVSCGSSSGGGIGGTGFVAGVIDGFGSVFVDGVEFETGAAQITIDGRPATEAELAIGMVVGVTGTVDKDALNGSAERLTVESLVVGPLDAVAFDARSVDVLSDRILIDTDTVVDGVTLTPDDLGTVVRISGFLDADGNIRATRIARDRSGTSELVVSGVVRDLDESSESFRIRSVTIDYSGARLEGIPTTGLRNGLIAHAASRTRPIGGVVVADRVRVREDRLLDRKGTSIRASGVVSQRPDARHFVLNERISVRIVDATEIVGGTLVDLRRNALVSLTGRTDDRKTVVARIVFIRKSTVDAAIPQSN